jgi:hypothetical protein
MSGATGHAIAPARNRAHCLPCRVVELEELAHLRHPARLHESDMVRVRVVTLVRGSIGELHRDPEPIPVLRADLRQQLEPLHARNGRQPLGGLQEVTLSRRPGSMDEREGNGMPNSLPVDPRTLLHATFAPLPNARRKTAVRPRSAEPTVSVRRGSSEGSFESRAVGGLAVRRQHDLHGLVEQRPQPDCDLLDRDVFR